MVFVRGIFAPDRQLAGADGGVLAREGVLLHDAATRTQEE